MRTSMYSILCIVIRLGAVIFMLSTITDIGKLVFSYGRGDFSSAHYFWGFAFTLAAFVIAVVLVLCPEPLARLIAGSDGQEVFESSISAAEIQWVALSILGVYTVMSGLIGLSSWLADTVSIPTDWVVGDEFRRQRKLDVFYHVLRTALGLALTFGAKGLTGLLHRLRHGASQRIDDAARQSLDSKP